MGFVGSLINGGDSGDSGSAGFNYQAKGPQGEQMTASWDATQNALGHQRNFLDAVQGQGGLNNQSNVFQQQQMLANNLQQQAAGAAGPSIAQAQYQQNMNQIGAQQAGSLGSQKGISPALQARLIAQQGAGAQQAGAGQYATLGAQEQWAATQALQQQQANMANLSTQQVGQQANATNAYTQANLGQQSNLYGLQSGATAANAGVAGKTIGGQEKLVGSLFGGASMAHGGLVKGYADGGQVMNISDPAPIAQQVAAPDGPASNVGMQLNYGHAFANPSIQFDPDAADPQKQKKQQKQNDGSQSSIDPENAPVDMGEGAAAGSVDMAPVESADIAGGAAEAGASSGLMEGAAAAMSKGGAVKNFAMGGDTGGDASGSGAGGGIMQFLPMLAMLLNKGGGVPLNGEAYAAGEKPVPGQASVKGDSLQNDTVPARLSPGEVIIPRSIMNSKNPPAAAAKMVRDIIAKKKKASNGL